MLPRKTGILLPNLVTVLLLSCQFLSAQDDDGVCHHFNRLCTCRASHHEIICRGVPFHEFPAFPTQGVYQLTIVRSGLDSLEDGVFEGSNVASLHLMHNDIEHVADGSFRGLEHILTTLDLSHNQLPDVPIPALRSLRALSWLNFASNRISDVAGNKWVELPSRHALHSLFLGSNRISQVEEGAFLHLTHLQLLDLQSNYIEDIGARPFPGSLISLSLADNILQSVPLHAVYYLRHLRRLQLQGNLIRHLPCPFHLRAGSLEQLQLANNLLRKLSDCIFDGSFVVKELHLEFNFLRQLPARALSGSQVQRLVVANNRIRDVHSDAFAGVERTIITLDLGFNLLEHFPTAINDLTSLVFLSLKSNLLKHLGEGHLRGSRGTLEVLDLSGNLFTSVPNLCLKHLTKLVRLSLQDNRIRKVYRDDFHSWGKSLATLSLANNRMTYLSADTFVHLTKLKELKLSFNALAYVDQNVLFPLKKCLEFLDLSSAFSSFNHPVDTFVRNMEKLEWLQFDHNNISKFSVESMKSMRKLRHIDMSNNNLKEIPDDLFDYSSVSFLATLHFNSNEINLVKSGTFDGMSHLTSVVLFGNKISVIESFAIANCPFLHSVVLTKNNLTVISTSAFYNLSRLSNVFLQDNYLENFTFDIFDGETSQLYINVSNNALRYLEAKVSNLSYPLKVRTLDLTCNFISVIPEAFLSDASSYLLHLFLSRNLISDFASPSLPVLQVLELSFNRLSSLCHEQFFFCPDLQILSLNDNNISNISDSAFSNLKKLRILNLSNNKLIYLPENSFSGTRLERLNISGNHFINPPVEAFASAQLTLRHLDLSFNRIHNLSDYSFSNLLKLKALNLSSNQITTLPEKSFASMGHLIKLDASNNPLSGLEESTFGHLGLLRSLYLRNASLVAVCYLSLPHLNVLDLSENFLGNISLSGALYKLQRLDLSGNLLQEIPLHLWREVRALSSLDISRNPVSVLSTGSFNSLQRLQELDISGLLLKRLDPRALHPLRSLTVLRTDSYSSVRSFRLRDLLSECPAVRKVTLKVEESTLSHQVQGAFGTKLRELFVTGNNLKRVLPDAFGGLRTHELTVRISGTAVQRFPDGLLRYLPDVRYLTLDLRGNRLTSMGPKVLAAATREGPDIHQTQHISGGVMLEDNPWNCSCELLWLGSWLRRWLRETFHVHMLGIEAALYVNSVSRNARCFHALTNRTLPIIDLKESDVPCQTQISHAGKTVAAALSTVLSAGISWWLGSVFLAQNAWK